MCDAALLRASEALAEAGGLSPTGGCSARSGRPLDRTSITLLTANEKKKKKKEKKRRKKEDERDAIYRNEKNAAVKSIISYLTRINNN